MNTRESPFGVPIGRAQAAPLDVEGMTALALRGLPRMYRANHHRFAQTVRRSTSGGAVSVEGANSRYGSIVVLGAAKLDLFSQRRIFAGSTAAFVAEAIAER